MGKFNNMVTQIKGYIFLIVAVFILAAGFGIGYAVFHHKPLPVYDPGPEIHRLDSINTVLKDSIAYWHIKQKQADSVRLQLDSDVINLKIKYDKLRKKITDANADDNLLILSGYLSE